MPQAPARQDRDTVLWPALLVLLLVALLPACSSPGTDAVPEAAGDESAAGVPASHTRMIDRLREIADRTDAENRYLGSGVTEPQQSFPTWFWDYDNDGVLDLWVAPYPQGRIPDKLQSVVASYLGLPSQSDTGRLYRGLGDGRFEDVTESHGVARVTMAMGANWGDLDNDGYPDFYLGTGYPFFDGLLPNVMYHNQRGRGFADVTTSGGFGHLQKGHGVVFADLDNDGDQDVFEQMGGAFPGDRFGNVLYENPGFGNHWVQLQLVGVDSNRQGVGAQIRVEVIEDGNPRTIYRTVSTGGSFGAGSWIQHIGLGRAERVVGIEIYWPKSDTRQQVGEVPLDRRLVVTEGAAGYRDETPASFVFASG